MIPGKSTFNNYDFFQLETELESTRARTHTHTLKHTHFFINHF